ncbi:MAG: hypothetical protein OXC12_14825 [Spirochaetaceae bacterium]|nr:hypothetical protein [Spirochaetaceae bacterium]
MKNYLRENIERYQIDGSIRINGSWYSPFRRYRTGPRLRAELESHGFKVLHQTGELGQNLVAVREESRSGLHIQ